MEYQKIINFFDIHRKNHLNLEDKIALKKMITRLKRAALVVKSHCPYIKFKSKSRNKTCSYC